MSTSATTERSVVDVLRAAKERISDPERHTRLGVYAVNADGFRVGPASSEACQWCAQGSVLAERGIELFMDRSDDRLAVDATNLLNSLAPNGNAARLNDEDGHQAVLDLYDRAIELAEARA